MKPKILSRMDGLDTWDTRHITNTSYTDPTNKTESESKWSWKVTCLIVPILSLSTILF